MEMSPYVENLQRDLGRAAEAGGDEARVVADRLIAALESSVRLMLLDALSAASDEITRELAPGSVEVRLRSGEPEFVVAPPAPVPPGEPEEVRAPPPPPPPLEPEDGATARINVRMPEPLKARVEQAAARERLSVNAWLVRVAAAAVDDPGAGRGRRRSVGPGDSFTGWVR